MKVNQNESYQCKEEAAKESGPEIVVGRPERGFFLGDAEISMAMLTSQGTGNDGFLAVRAFVQFAGQCHKPNIRRQAR
jgi:hypothetical protein